MLYIERLLEIDIPINYVVTHKSPGTWLPVVIISNFFIRTVHVLCLTAEADAIYKIDSACVGLYVYMSIVQRIVL